MARDKEKVNAQLTPEFFTNLPMDNTKKHVPDYKGAWGQLGSALTNIGDTISKGVNDFDDLKLQQFKSVVNAKHVEYMTRMGETNNQDEREALTDAFKKEIDVLSKNKNLLNDRQKNKWDTKYREPYMMTVNENHDVESFLGLRRNVRAESVRSAQLLVDSISGGDEQFAAVVGDAERIKDIVKQYTQTKDYDVFANDLDDKIYSTKAMKDVDNGRYMEVMHQMKLGGGKYKVSQKSAAEIYTYANKIYHITLQNNMAMWAIAQGTDSTGYTDYVIASESLASVSSQVDYEDLEGASKIVEARRSIYNKNKTALEENAAYTRFNTALKLESNGAPFDTIKAYLTEYDPNFTPSDERAAINFFEDRANGVGPTKGLGPGYLNLLGQVFDKRIITENDPRLQTALMRGMLTENGFNKLQVHIKEVQNPVTQTAAIDITKSVQTLEDSADVMFGSPAEKAYIMDRLVDYIAQNDLSTPKGREEVNRLRELPYLKDEILKIQQQYPDLIADTQARIDFENAKEKLNVDIPANIDQLRSDVQNRKIKSSDEFIKRRNKIIESNTYRQDKQLYTYFDDVEEILNGVEDLFYDVKNGRQEVVQPELKPAPIRENRQPELKRANAPITRNKSGSSLQPVKHGMTIEQAEQLFLNGRK